ncbi:MAG: glycosyltransferase family 4 protein [Planctomycetota bacterium]|jgi:glycosyltransferase involved in cell wall biosynthesis
MPRSRFNLASPIEDGIGYGLCGTNLAIELSRLADVNITCFCEQATVPRPLEQQWLLPRIRATGTDCDPALPTLYVQDVGPRPPGAPVILYTCLDTARPSAVRRACYAEMDVLVGMAQWNADAFRAAGFTNVHVVPQGIDPTLFFPRPVSRRVYEDRYVFFSGGKFEYRKGQDIVLAAWKVFHERHPDSLLVAGWYNAWPRTMQTMSLSSHVQMTALERYEDLPGLLALNGIDPASVILLPPMPNWAYASVYHQCNAGVFPTRGEPATNLPMMELMACGRPVVASMCGGQTDVLRPEHNCRALTSFTREPAGHARPPAEDLGRWWTPSVEELIAEMEWCYENRDAATALGQQAAADLHAGFTWRHAAERFVGLIKDVAPTPLAAAPA